MEPHTKVSPESLIPQLRSTLKRCLYCSPAYGVLKRQLAEYLIQTEKSLEGVMHLMESLGGKYKFDHLKLEQEWELTGRGQIGDSIENIEVVKSFNSIPCEYSSTEEFLSDLNSLPPEWTLVQITRQPRGGDILQAARGHLTEGVNFSLQETRLVVLNAGQVPLQVLLDKPLGSGDSINPMKSFFELISEALTLLSRTSAGRKNREEASNLIKEVSKAMGDSWLREYQCFLPGNPKCPLLKQSVADSVSKINNSLVTMTTEARTYLYRLLSGSHLISNAQIESLVSRHVAQHDELLTQHVTTCVLEFKNQYSVELSNAARYPVILLLEEELDKLPWETTLPLRSSPVTRVHCFQFVMSLVKVHGLQTDNKKSISTLRNGYLQMPKIQHEKDTFVILNPSSDVPALETNFKTFLIRKLGQWKGMTGRAPSATEFSTGLTHSLFIYCGHGNGTLYLSSDKLGRCRVRSVAMLFGCRSVERAHLGGRVPFSSIAQKYFIAGSPCIIGNLWNVSSTDCDRLAANLINLSLPSPPASPSLLNLPSITPVWWNVPYPRVDTGDSQSNGVGNSDSAVGNSQSNGVGNSDSAVGNSRSNGVNISHSNGTENCFKSKRDVGGSRCAVQDVSEVFSQLWTDSVAAKTVGKSVRKQPGTTRGDLIVAQKGESLAKSANFPVSASISTSHSPDLALNIQWSRGGANYFINSAALVMWGLPVWFGDTV